MFTTLVFARIFCTRRTFHPFQVVLETKFLKAKFVLHKCLNAMFRVVFLEIELGYHFKGMNVLLWMEMCLRNIYIGGNCILSQKVKVCFQEITCKSERALWSFITVIYRCFHHQIRVQSNGIYSVYESIFTGKFASTSIPFCCCKLLFDFPFAGNYGCSKVVLCLCIN